jgi:hypothetical protein
MEVITGSIQAQEHKLDLLEQTITDLDQLMRGTHKDHEEERKVLEDLPQDKLNPRSIPEDSPRQPIIYLEGVDEKKLNGGCKTLTI